MKVSREKWEKSFSEWFDRVLFEGEFYDYGRYPVKGTGVWMPYGFKLRQNILELLRRLLEQSSHEEILLPMLIPEDLLRKEAEHIRGFEGEVLWVTRGGKEELDVKLALRPTSEVAITYMESLWIRSYKQLPKKYYQIVSIFRYETKATRPMLRLREVTSFKEAHTLHETYEDAERQIWEAVEIYKRFFDELGIPYLISKRPEWDKFAGAVYTIAFDTIMPDGRVLQIGTVHHLGQHFTRAFDYKIQRKDGTLDYPHQTSYGISDRIIAVSITINGDDHGPILNPIIAPIKVVIIPIPGKTEEETEKVFNYAEQIGNILKEANIECYLDKDREKTPGEKFYIWELKGVPLRVEIGPRELANNTVYIKTRHDFKGREVARQRIIEEINITLNNMRRELRERAWEFFKSKLSKSESLEEAKHIIENKGGIVEVKWCGNTTCGLKIEELANLRVLGEPIEKVEVKGNCVICGNYAKTLLRLAKTY